MYNKPFFNHPPSYPPQRYDNYPFSPQQPPQQMQQQQSFNPYVGQNATINSQTPFYQFAKPKQPVNWYQNMQQQQQQTGNYQQPYPGPTSGLLSQFQDENGQINLDKMLSTVGQMANTYHQVQPIIKQFGNLVKTFK